MQLSGELKVLGLLFVGALIYCVSGALFGVYVGAPVGWETLLLLVGYLWFSAFFVACSFFVISRVSIRWSTFYPSGFLDLFLLAISVLGVVFIGIDRVFYRDLNIFELSFAEIRATLNRESGAGEGGSLFSLVGNLFQLLYLVVIARLVFYWEEYASLSLARAGGLVLLAILALFASSYMLGGRTLLLLFVSIIVGTMLLRVCFGRKMIPLNLPSWWIVLGILLGFMFSVLVFWVRSKMGGADISSSVYLEKLLAHLHPYREDFYGVAIDSPGYLGDILNFSLAVLAYIFHQLWVFEAVMSSDGEGSALLIGLGSLLPNGFNRISPVFEGLFFSVPAALYYDFGLFGVVIGSVFIPFVIFVATLFFKLNPRGISVFFPSFCVSLIVASPIGFLLNIPYAIIIFGVAAFMMALELGYRLILGQPKKR